VPKNILFLTTTSIAANPRLQKELVFYKGKAKCHVVYFKREDWSATIDKAFTKQHSTIFFHPIAARDFKLYWYYLKLAQKLCIMLQLFKVGGIKSKIISSVPAALLLKKKVKHLKLKNINVISTHNLGAIVAGAFLKSAHTTLHIDIEDYHPGEQVYFNQGHEQKLREQLLNYSFNKATSISYASGGIATACKQYLKIPTQINQAVVLNSFPSNEFILPKEREEGKIKCVWFSQHINHSRGLEAVLESIKDYPTIELHLIGNANTTFLAQFNLGDNVTLHKPMPQKELHHFLAEMDVGLALEDVKAEENRQLCLTNKILAYAQAGLYIAATHTNAQQQFLASLSYEAGFVLNSTTEISQQICSVNSDVFSLEEKQKRFENGKILSWERECLILENYFE